MRRYPLISLKGRRGEGSSFDESLLDLFSLISFFLIIIAFGYAVRAARKDPVTTPVSADMAKPSSGVPDAVPKNVVLLIVHRQDNSDQLTMMDGLTGKTTRYPVGAQTVTNVLTGVKGTLMLAQRINIAILEGNAQGNPSIWLALQRWLAESGFRNFGIYFANE